MGSRIHEQISALVDGELDPGETKLLLRRFAQDPELKAAWERYQRCGELVEEAVETPIGADIADDVRAAIEAEDPPVTPARRAPEWTRPVAGVAVAATVATVAVLSLQGPTDSDPATESEAVTVVPGDRAEGTPWGGSAYWFEPRPAAGGDAGQAATRQRLDTYLINHTDQSVGLFREELPASEPDSETEGDPE